MNTVRNNGNQYIIIKQKIEENKNASAKHLLNKCEQSPLYVIQCKNRYSNYHDSHRREFQSKKNVYNRSSKNQLFQNHKHSDEHDIPHINFLGITIDRMNGELENPLSCEKKRQQNTSKIFNADAYYA